MIESYLLFASFADLKANICERIKIKSLTFIDKNDNYEH